MNIQTELRDDHQARLTVEFDQETFQGFKQKAARQIAKEAKIPGFRPGKAPYDVVRRIYGDDAIAQQAVELLVDALYPAILKEANIEPGAAGSLEDVASMEPLTLVFLVPLEPVINLGNYRTIRLPYEAKTVAEEDVEKVIERLRKNSALVEPVERAAESGDLVAFAVDAHLTKPDEGQDATIITDDHTQLIIGDAEETWPVPGFSHNLIGLSAGDEKTIAIIFPEDEADENLRGKDVEFHVKVESVKVQSMPEPNDEWAQSMGQFQTMQDLRDDVRRYLENQQSNEYDEQYFDQLLDLVVAGAEIKYPPQVLDEEVEHILEHISHDLEHQHMDLETYIKMLNLSRESFIETEVLPAAKHRLQRSLIITELGRAERIEIKPEDMNEVAQEAIGELQSISNLQSLRKIPNDLRQQVTMNAMARILNRRTLQRIKAIATGEAESEPSADAEPAADGETPADNETAANTTAEETN